MKIMQINVWQGRLLTPLLSLIEQESPDLIMTQEVYSYPRPVADHAPMDFIATLESFAKVGHFQYTYFSPANTFDIFGHEVGYGNAILSKFSFEHTSTEYTGGPGPIHLNDPAAYDGNAGRNFQHVVINTGRTGLNVINHHGHWIPDPLGNNVTTKRLLKIAAYIKNLDGPVLMCGDLNVSLQSPAIRKFREAVGLRDLVDTTDTHTTLSQAHYIKNIVCDYIFTSPELKINRIEVSEKLVSDHKAVIAEIDT